MGFFTGLGLHRRGARFQDGIALARAAINGDYDDWMRLSAAQQRRDRPQPVAADDGWRTGSAGLKALKQDARSAVGFAGSYLNAARQRGVGVQAFDVAAGAAQRADAAGRAVARRAQHRLGSLSERYETSGRGPGTINPGTNDPGGASYGSYQMATNSGIPQEFLRNEGQRWAREFGGAAPGTGAFDQAWARIAARDREAFADAQHAFIERERYRPAIRRVFDNNGLNVDARANASAMRPGRWQFSTATHHD